MTWLKIENYIMINITKPNGNSGDKITSDDIMARSNETVSTKTLIYQKPFAKDCLPSANERKLHIFTERSFTSKHFSGTFYWKAYEAFYS